MKKVIPALTMLSLLLISQSCMDEIETTAQKPVIGFTLPDDQQLLNDPASYQLIISVASGNGEPVMEFEEVTYAYSDGRFVTQPLDLPIGSYTITDFMLINENDDIVYAVPRMSGTLGQSVTHPLDADFTLSPSGGQPRVDLRLLDVRSHKASDFGYASFKRPGQRLSIRVSAEGNSKATAANAFIVHGQDTVGRYSLQPKMNRIAIPAGITEDHKLLISKDGYAPRYFGLQEEMAKKKTINVVLSPAFTLLAFIDFNVSSTFDFYLGGPEGSTISVDWGDGATEVFELEPSQVNVVHTFPANGNYAVTITGDIDRITSFYSFYGQAMIDAISFQHLTDLEEIRFGLTRSPKVLDLSYNSKLQAAMLTGLDNLEELKLPEKHRMLSLSLEGPNRMSGPAVDRVIDNLYSNVVGGNLTNGTFNLAASWAQEEGDDTLLGPPSAESLQKLHALKQEYLWMIAPDPFE